MQRALKWTFGNKNRMIHERDQIKRITKKMKISCYKPEAMTNYNGNVAQSCKNTRSSVQLKGQYVGSHN